LDAYTIKDLSFTYPNREIPAVNHVSCTITQGEFVTICGHSGSGKTTLLRQLKPSCAPHGLLTGSIDFEQEPLASLSERDASAKIGFVFQSIDNQIVTDKVWHELAFGLESLGIPSEEIRLRVAEMASFFGIQTWFYKSVSELSGGQKQILALASIMALQPSVLILDEPTSQLDPIAAGEFFAILGKINRELGVTIILTEHRLEEVLPLSNRLIVMESGQIVADGTPKDVGVYLQQQQNDMMLAMPTPSKVWMACTNMSGSSEIPLTVGEGARWLKSQPIKALFTKKRNHANQNKEPAIILKDCWFKYEKNSPDVIKGLNFTAHFGALTTILGGNGTGKTTALSLMSGIHKAYRGDVYTENRVYALPQNPQSLFVAKTVRGDLLEILSEKKISKEEKDQKLAVIVKLCKLDGLLDYHPYDLSGGEQQRAALAKVLLLQPRILLLDEPTKGLDAQYKQIFAAILRKLTDAGVAVVMVSHDLEFCAEYADYCALFFDGNIVTENTPMEFFNGNSFYTTAANRMARHVLPDVITANDIIVALGGHLMPEPDVLDFDARYDAAHEVLPPPPKTKKMNLSRTIILSLFVCWFFASIIIAYMNVDRLMAFIGGGQEAVVIANDGALVYIGILVLLSVGLIGIVMTLSYKRGQPVLQKQKKPLSKRTLLAALFVLITIPLTIYIGVTFFDDRRFYFVSMLIIFQTMLPFVFIFEGRKPQAREIIVIAVLCGIAVAGRSAFFMLPQFKPVVAVVIIAGVAFGGESGFLVGAVTGFVSNMFFGQGPWTPWQMFALGIIGFTAGLLFRKGWLSRNTLPLAVFGGFATFIIYGGIMNPASVIMWQPNPTAGMFLTAYLHGIPFDLVHAIATVTFLVLISKPMLEKLDRIKVKYGLVE